MKILPDPLLIQDDLAAILWVRLENVYKLGPDALSEVIVLKS